MINALFSHVYPFKLSCSNWFHACNFFKYTRNGVTPCWTRLSAELSMLTARLTTTPLPSFPQDANYYSGKAQGCQVLAGKSIMAGSRQLRVAKMSRKLLVCMENCFEMLLFEVCQWLFGWWFHIFKLQPYLKIISNGLILLGWVD